MTATTTALTPRAGLAVRGSAARRFGALVAAETRILFRNTTAVLTALALPVLTAAMYSGLAPDRTTLGTLVVTVLLTTGLLFVVYYTVVGSLVGRREQLVLKRLIAGEPSRLEVLLAPAVPLWGILVAQAALGVAAAVALGAPLTHPWAIALAVLGGAAAWTALGIWSATWTRTLEAAQLTTMPLILVSLLLSGFSVPLSVLPAGAQAVAHWLPMAPVVDLIVLGTAGVDASGRAVTGGDAALAAASFLLPLAAWTAVALVQGVRSFRWDARS